MPLILRRDWHCASCGHFNADNTQHKCATCEALQSSEENADVVDDQKLQDLLQPIEQLAHQLSKRTAVRSRGFVQLLATCFNDAHLTAQTQVSDCDDDESPTLHYNLRGVNALQFLRVRLLNQRHLNKMTDSERLLQLKDLSSQLPRYMHTYHALAAEYHGEMSLDTLDTYLPPNLDIAQIAVAQDGDPLKRCVITHEIHAVAAELLVRDLIRLYETGQRVGGLSQVQILIREEAQTGKIERSMQLIANHVRHRVSSMANPENDASIEVEIQRRYRFLFNAALSAAYQIEDKESVRRVKQWMQQCKVQPDATSYNAQLAAALNLRDENRIDLAIRAMDKNPANILQAQLGDALNMCTKANALQAAKAVFQRMISTPNYELTVPDVALMISLAIREKDLPSCTRLYDAILIRRMGAALAQADASNQALFIELYTVVDEALRLLTGADVEQRLFKQWTHRLKSTTLLEHFANGVLPLNKEIITFLLHTWLHPSDGPLREVEGPDHLQSLLNNSTELLLTYYRARPMKPPCPDLIDLIFRTAKKHMLSTEFAEPLNQMQKAKATNGRDRSRRLIYERKHTEPTGAYRRKRAM